jgi:hypothetical protein
MVRALEVGGVDLQAGLITPRILGGRAAQIVGREDSNLPLDKGRRTRAKGLFSGRS